MPAGAISATTSAPPSTRSTDQELEVVRDINVDGETLRYSRADIFVHVLIHERQHHGDLNTLLYQHGIEAPIVEYRFSLPARGA